MANDRTILVTGVTGNQGGAVAQALQGSGFHLRGLTRKPDSERAAALARHGVEVGIDLAAAEAQVQSSWFWLVGHRGQHSANHSRQIHLPAAGLLKDAG